MGRPEVVVEGMKLTLSVEALKLNDALNELEARLEREEVVEGMAGAAGGGLAAVRPGPGGTRCESVVESERPRLAPTASFSLPALPAADSYCPRRIERGWKGEVGRGEGRTSGRRNQYPRTPHQ